MTLRVTPADCSTEVTVKDENKQEAFSGSAQEFAAYRFTTPGSYTAKLVVSSGEGYQSEPTVSGHQTYEFTFDVTIKATVRLNTQAVTPGGVVAVKVTGQQTDTKPSLTAELPDTGFRASATGDGWVAYLAVRWKPSLAAIPSRSPWTARCRSLPEREQERRIFSGLYFQVQAGHTVCRRG